MSKIFISYSRTDEQFARQIATSLSEAGADVWIDTTDIPPGMKWSTAIQLGLDTCDTMIVVISPESMSSNNVEDEWQYFLDNNKRVIPILFKTAKIHFQLSRLQYIDFSNRPFELALTQLYETLGIELSDEYLTQKRVLEILRRSYMDWKTFGLQKDQLLESKHVSLIWQHAKPSHIVDKVAGYVITSMTLPQNQILVDKYSSEMRNWIDYLGIDAVEDVFVSNIANLDKQTRIGTLRIIEVLRLVELADLIFDRLQVEPEIDVINTALQTVYKLEKALPERVAEHLLSNVDNWLAKSYALWSFCDKRCALIISDGTDFSKTIGQFAADSGFVTVEVVLDLTMMMDWQLQEYEFGAKVLSAYDMIVLVRGDHYGSTGNERFYATIQDFVKNGGVLFATAWLGWETKHDANFSEILPFTYHQFIEDVTLHCLPTSHSNSRELFPEDFSYYASYERMSPRTDSYSLLVTETGVPIFGYREIESGRCYYFNTCQHSCTKPMESPFVSSRVLRDSIRRTMDWIYKQIS